MNDERSTPTNRRVTVKGTPARLERMVLDGKPHVVTNAGVFQPGKYRGLVDAERATITITPAEEATHEH